MEDSTRRTQKKRKVAIIALSIRPVPRKRKVVTITPPTEPDLKKLNEDWLLKKYHDEISIQARTAWDLYIKWYTVFVSVNVTALGVVSQFIAQENRGPIVIAFIGQNIISAITSISIGCYSLEVKKNMADVSCALSQVEDVTCIPLVVLRTSPFPGKLALWSGIANAIGCVLLLICWVALFYMHSPIKRVETSPNKLVSMEVPNIPESAIGLGQSRR